MRINTILPGYISSLGGPSYVCHHLLETMSASGIEVCLHCVSGDNNIYKSFHRHTMPFWAKPFGYKLFSQDRWEKYTEWRYLRSFKDKDLAYIWNFTSIDTYKTIKSAGHLILTENMNTHQATSKEILDAEYNRLGLVPDHGIDEKSITLESAKLELVDYVFSPSGEVTKSLLKAHVPNEKIIRSSYGLSKQDILLPQEIADRGRNAELTAIFVGRIGIRKGVHLLLDYWAKAGVKGKLKLVGRIEPSARHLVEPYLNRHDVEHVPFTSDLRSVYKNADVFLFPSLEEGSPLVTYLSLGSGLASIVSKMGGDGIIDHGYDGLVVEAHNADEWIDSIRTVFADTEFRINMSRNAYDKAGKFLWGKVGRQRAEALLTSLNVIHNNSA